MFTLRELDPLASKKSAVTETTSFDYETRMKKIWQLQTEQQLPENIKSQLEEIRYLGTMIDKELKLCKMGANVNFQIEYEQAQLKIKIIKEIKLLFEDENLQLSPGDQEIVNDSILSFQDEAIKSSINRMMHLNKLIIQSENDHTIQTPSLAKELEKLQDQLPALINVRQKNLEEYCDLLKKAIFIQNEIEIEGDILLKLVKNNNINNEYADELMDLLDELKGNFFNLFEREFEEHTKKARLESLFQNVCRVNQKIAASIDSKEDDNAELMNEFSKINYVLIAQEVIQTNENKRLANSSMQLRKLQKELNDFKKNIPGKRPFLPHPSYPPNINLKKGVPLIRDVIRQINQATQRSIYKLNDLDEIFNQIQQLAHELKTFDFKRKDLLSFLMSMHSNALELHVNFKNQVNPLAGQWLLEIIKNIEIKLKNVIKNFEKESEQLINEYYSNFLKTPTGVHLALFKHTSSNKVFADYPLVDRIMEDKSISKEQQTRIIQYRKSLKRASNLETLVMILNNDEFERLCTDMTKKMQLFSGFTGHNRDREHPGAHVRPL